MNKTRPKSKGSIWKTSDVLMVIREIEGVLDSFSKNRRTKFRSLSDSVWINETFLGETKVAKQAENNTKKPSIFTESRKKSEVRRVISSISANVNAKKNVALPDKTVSRSYRARIVADLKIDKDEVFQIHRRKDINSANPSTRRDVFNRIKGRKEAKSFVRDQEVGNEFPASEYTDMHSQASLIGRFYQDFQ